MMPSNLEIDRLAEGLRSDNLEPEDFGKIRDIIRYHPRARRRLVEHLYLAADLREVIPNCREQLNPSFAIPQWAWGAAGSLLASAAAVVLVFWQPWVQRGVTKEPVSVSAGVNELDSAGIAVISKTSNVNWGERTTLSVSRLESGSPVGKGVLEIEDGVVQIDFYSGATVILEGPACIRLESPELGRLDYGNLWAHVPPPARGFRVETASFDVIDLGTEFGMTVGLDGRGEIHVIDGEVEVLSTHDEGAIERLLLTGEGIEVEIDGSTAEIEARPDDFLGSSHLSQAARDRFEKWKVHRKELMKSPDVLVGYLFDRESPWERTIMNQAECGPKDVDGAIVGCEWTEGRWSGKRALAFSNSSHRVRLNLPGRYQALTLASWVRVDELESAELSLLHPDTSQERFVHWTLTHVQESGHLHLHFSETVRSEGWKEDRNHFHCDWNLIGPKHGSLGEWMHLAVVYDPVNNQVTHYQNGKVIGVNAIDEPRELEVGIVDLGNWPYREWAKDTEFEVRNLNGAIDEFLIMNRAYEPEEIRELWATGKP